MRYASGQYLEAFGWKPVKMLQNGLAVVYFIYLSKFLMSFPEEVDLTGQV
jgi:hypothetical protein